MMLVVRRRKRRSPSTVRTLFNKLACTVEQLRGNGETKQLGGLEIDDQFELCRLLNRQVPRLSPLQNLIDVGWGQPPRLVLVMPIREQPAIDRVEPVRIHRRQL